MQRPAAPVGGLGALLGRLGPGDHGLVFGPTGFTPGLVEALLHRAAALDFQLLVAHAGEDPVLLRAAVERAPGARAALAARRVRVLDGAAFAVLRDGVAQRGIEALAPVALDAEQAGLRGALLCLLHGDKAPEGLAPFEAALAARLPTRLAVQCVYPAPPSAREPALRLLRAHTPGRMVMPGLWRVAEQGHARWAAFEGSRLGTPA